MSTWLHLTFPGTFFTGKLPSDLRVFLPPQTDIIESPDINNRFAKLWPSDLQLRGKSAKLFSFENSSNLSLPNVAGPSISFFVVPFEVYYGAQLASSLQLAAWSNANVEAEDSGHPEAQTCMGWWFCLLRWVSKHEWLQQAIYMCLSFPKKRVDIWFCCLMVVVYCLFFITSLQG